MSAFIVRDNTINRVVTYLAQDPYLSRDVFQVTGLMLESEGSQAQLAQDMYALNVKAVEQRYGGKADPSEHVWQPEPCGDIYQVLKSLSCWHYQCSEGDIPETSELYQLMERIQDRIAYRIVTDLPRYGMAAWG